MGKTVTNLLVCIPNFFSMGKRMQQHLKYVFLPLKLDIESERVVFYLELHIPLQREY